MRNELNRKKSIGDDIRDTDTSAEWVVVVHGGI